MRDPGREDVMRSVGDSAVAGGLVGVAIAAVGFVLARLARLGQLRRRGG